MEFYLLAGVGITLVLSIIAGYWKSRNSSASLASYYLGDRNLSSTDLAHLLGASSMSLNGLFYHSWLGYKIGIYSLIVQAFWAASFLFFIFSAKTFVELARQDSLFGNFQRYFGKPASVIAAAAVGFTMLALVGWELAIAGGLAKEVFSLTRPESFAVVLVIVVIIAIYTVRGGLLANKRANILQNYLKALAFVAILLLSVALFQSPEKYLIEFGFVPNQSINYLKLSPIDAAIGAGGLAALLCNLLFSMFWQPADATAWQNFSAGSNKGTGDTGSATRANILAMIRVFIFPGLAGTFLGISLAGIPISSDQQLMPTIFSAYQQLPYGNWMVLGISIMLTAAMVSTVDGLLLGFSYTMNRDVLPNKDFDQIIAGVPKGGQVDIRRERSLLMLGKTIVILAAVLSLFLYILIDNQIIGLFETVYLAVIGQMAVAPMALALLWKKDLRTVRSLQQRLGWMPVFAGFAVGIFCFFLFVTGTPMAYVSSNSIIGGLPFIILAPPAAFFVALLGVFCLHIFARR